MAEGHVPAWKRLGLKVKSVVENDPLAVTHLGGEEDLKKHKKDGRSKSKKRSLDAHGEEGHGEKASKKQKKPPKRVKLPKNERPPPPEKDQLAYLRQFAKDKEHWKFSKQKQNWVLRNLREVPEEYVEYLSAYVSTMKGGAKSRLVEEMAKVVEEWNMLVEGGEEKEEEESKEEESTDGDVKADSKDVADESGSEVKTEDGSSGAKPDNSETSKKSPAPPAETKKPATLAWALRAALLYKALCGVELHVESIDEESDNKESRKESDREKSDEIVEDVEVTEYL